MGKLWAVIQREYLERVRSRWFLFATFFGPLLFGAIAFLPPLLAMRSTPSRNLAHVIILDATGAGLGARVAAALDSGRTMAAAGTRLEVIAPAALTAAESAATHAVMRRAAEGYLVLDYRTLAGESARYAGRNASAISDVSQINAAVRQSVLAVRLAQAHLDPNLTDALTHLDVDLHTERITDAGRSGGSGTADAVFGFAVAFLLYMSIILYGQHIMRGVMEEKSTRVAEVVVSSVSPDTLLAGKVLGVGAVGLTQQLIWIITAVALARARAPILARFGVPAQDFILPSVSVGTGAALLLFFVLGFILYAALFAAVGATVSNEQDAQQAAMPVMLLLIVSIIFVQPILVEPTSSLAVAMSMIPFSSPIIMPLRLAVTSVSGWALAASVALLGAGCVAAVWLAARIYRVGLLMYGKRPNLREMLRWIRVAG